VARLAYEEGVRLYRMAIDAGDSTSDKRLYVELLLGLGDAQGRAGDTPSSKATFLDAAELLRDTDANELFARAALGYAAGFVWNRAAGDMRVVPLLREALDRLPTDDSLQRVRVLARLAGARRDEMSRAPRDALSREAVEIAERLGDPAVLAYALAGRFCAIWGPDTSEEMRSIAARALLMAEQGGDRERLGEALMISLLVHTTFGDRDSTLEMLSRYRALGEELSSPSIRWYAAVAEAVQLLTDGRLAQTETLIESTRELGSQVYAWDSEMSYRLALSMLRWEQGRLGEVEDLVRDSFARSPGYRVFHCILALCYLETGRIAEARGMTADLLAGGEDALPYTNDWLSGMTLLAEVVSRAPMPEAAAATYERIKPYEDFVGSAGGEPVTGSMHRPLGQLAALLGNLENAQRHHERALEVHSRMRAELWIARSECDLADVLRQQQDTGATVRAQHLSARALHRAESLGLTALAARIRSSYGTGSAASTRPGGLTKREVEVAALVASGASNREIAVELVISERTAETHVQNILTKLGFGTRSQIAAWATTEKLDTDT
jgi:DNA-binding CsgD family transcriptional regulator/tetratricopeptide (TPR) repeat protein